VSVNVVPYVAPVQAVAPPPAPPVPVTLTGQTLVADKPTVMVGDHVTLSGVLNFSDGTTKPVTAYSMTWDHALLSTPNYATPRFLALAPGLAKIRNSNSGLYGTVEVTVIANDGTVFPPDPPPVVKPPAPPASPAPAPAPAQPPASTKAAYNGVVLRNVVTANNFSSGAVSGVWDWGDGTTDDMSVKTHAYTATGTYKVRLTTTAADGTSNYSDVHFGAIVPMDPVPLPASDLSGKPVTVHAELSDGYTTDITVNPGDVKPLDPTNQSRGAVVYTPDGLCVYLANDYAGTTGDITGKFRLSAGGVTVFDGQILLGAHCNTRPFWLKEPPLKASPDLSTMPILGKAPAASWASEYDKGDNGPTGVGNVLLAIGAGGEHATLGPVPEWDADYLANPTADNLRVVRGMADAIAPLPFHVRDFATGKMIDVRTYPKASMLDVQLGVGANPIVKFTTVWPFAMGQAQSHATNYVTLACELFGVGEDATDFHREQAAMWANYICSLNQNYIVRSPLGCCVFRSNAGRGFGRGLTVLLNAARNAPDEFRPLFQSWVDEAARDGAAAWVGQPGLGIMTQGGALDGNVNAYPNKEYPPWMQDILTQAVGQAIQYGHTGWQPIVDSFSNWTFARLEQDHEFATLYTAASQYADGTPATGWADGLKAKASYDAKFAAALAAPEGSAERAAYTGGNPGDFMGYPTSATGYPAMFQAALAMCVRYATDQVRAQAAWAIFHKWQRIDFSSDPKYDVVPASA
jgi:PKD repeat protein